MILLERFLEEFRYNCRTVLGSKPRIMLLCESYLCIDVNAERLLFFLLSTISYLYHRNPDLTDFEIQGEYDGDEDQIVLTILADKQYDIGTRERSSLSIDYSKIISLQEEVIDMFCQTYHVTRLESAADGSNRLSFRIPAPHDLTEEVYQLRSSNLEKYNANVEENTYSVYHLFLSEIKPFRFY